ncbi:hypothetical protein OYC40_24775, partial [Escherichia coli]|nr:hypothetical protein [Escherichia coli]MCY6794041.1 hypothetical protein [Escherichia coli]
FLRTAVNDFMDCVHHIWCPLFSQEFQDLPDGAETTLTDVLLSEMLYILIRDGSLMPSGIT